MKRFLLLLLFCTCFSCQETEQNSSSEPVSNDAEPLAKAKASGKALIAHDSNRTGIDFDNAVVPDEQFNFLEWEEIYNGGGVAVGDINNDGLPDIFFAGNQKADQLYLNKGDFKFENISTKAGIEEEGRWSTGVSFFDFNNDGWQDIYVCRTHWKMDADGGEERKNRLWINQGDMTFKESAKQYGLDNSGHSTQLAPIDYDLDGDLDLFLANTLSSNSDQKQKYLKQRGGMDLSDKLFRNDGNGKFTDVTEAAGLVLWAYTLGVSIADFNDDGYPDIYLANDYEGADCLYLNNKNGSFSNEVSRKMKHMSFYSMGCDAGDINNDGMMDLVVLDMQASDHYRSKTNMRSMSNKRFWEMVERGYQYQFMSNTLQLNQGTGFFSEVGELAGMSQTDWSWSALLEDIDGDGWQDLMITNGILQDIRNSDFLDGVTAAKEQGASRKDLYELSKDLPSEKLPNYLFQNNRALGFDNLSAEYGFDFKGFSHGAAVADFDLDGDPDVVISNSGNSAIIYENPNQNHLKIKFELDNKNKSGLGAKIRINQNGKEQYKNLQAIRAYKSASEAAVFFGLNGASKIDEIRVDLTDGRSWSGKNISTDKILVIKASDLQMDLETKAKPQPLLVDHTGPSQAIFRHEENAFDDFEREILLPHKLSKDGPKIAIGDINKDGKEDFFLGGASGSPGALFLQRPAGTFGQISGQPWEQDYETEDVDAVFFDANGDGQQDLLVISGGSEFQQGSRQYRDRLYLNSVNGFTRVEFPRLNFDASCVAVQDFDHDGDIDVFIGSKSIPGKYPATYASALLINENGNFVLSNDKYCEALNTAGMVRDAVWADVDGDSWEDLILVGEWMSPVIYYNKKGKKLEQGKTNDALTGWWFHVQASDLDGDGDLDFVLGNIGMNNKYKASTSKPLKVYASDFDSNKTNDIVLTKTSKDGELPVRGRECSSEQMPFIAEKFDNYDLFAKAQVSDIIGKDKLDNAVAYTAKEFRSGVWWNENGKMRFEAFPPMGQVSAVTGSAIQDLDKDGKKDIVLAGNLYDAEVETVRHDASNGCVLKGTGDQKFKALPPDEAGFYAPFNAKDVKLLSKYEGADFLILVSNNDFFLQVMRPNK